MLISITLNHSHKDTCFSFHKISYASTYTFEFVEEFCYKNKSNKYLKLKKKDYKYMLVPF